MATDREYLEMMAQNIDRRMTDGFTAIAEKIGEIKETQKENCADIKELKSDKDKNKGIFGLIAHAINFLGFLILGWLQVNK